MEKEKSRHSFSGSIGFVLAAAGSAVGLGNIWRFPYLAAKDGGGLYLVIYLILALTFGFTLLTTEIAIGRKTKQSPLTAYGKLKEKWKFLGVLACPNPKTGTVTDDTAKAVKEVKAGRVDYKVDKNANISAAVGKLSFSNESIAENIAALIDSVVKARPASAKGAYIESVTVSCAMCPGLPVDTASIAKL